jgi:YtcA family
VRWFRDSVPFPVATGLLFLLGGCGRAPSFNILGSYFPAWLLCLVVGILLTAIVYWALDRLQLGKEIVWTIVVYPCLTAFFAFTLWLIFFSV